MDKVLPVAPIFSGLQERSIGLLAERAQFELVPAGTMIVKQGETGNRMYVIEAGAVRVIRRCLNGAGEVELAQLRTGDFFGEGCILNTLPRVATVVATEETGLFSLSSISFYHLYREWPGEYSILVLNIARDLSRRLRLLDEKFAACH